MASQQVKGNGASSPVPTAASSRKTEQNVIGLYDAELVNRAFEDGSISADKLASGIVPYNDGHYVVAATGGDYTTVEEALSDLTVIAGLKIVLYIETPITDTVDFTNLSAACDEVLIVIKPSVQWTLDASISMDKDILVLGTAKSDGDENSTQLFMQGDSVISSSTKVQIRDLFMDGENDFGKKADPILTAPLLIIHGGGVPWNAGTLIDLVPTTHVVIHNSVLSKSSSSGMTVDLNGAGGTVRIHHSILLSLTHSTGFVMDAIDFTHNEVRNVTNVTFPAGNFSNTLAGITNPVP